jgi:phage repressor protein C with HTH and peptisase S24 domain
MGIFMKTLGERVKEERKKRRWSQADLGAKVGVSQAAISEIERDVPKSSGLVIPIAKAFKVDVNYLTDGKENISKQVADNSDIVIIGGKSGEVADPKEYVMIPRYDVRGSCGEGIDVNEVTIVDGMPMPVAWLRAQNLPEAHLLAVIEASGDSMQPTIEDGQTLIVNTVDIEPKSTKIYLICIDGKLFIKRLIYTPDGWIMRSDNPNKSNYPDFMIEEAKFSSIDIQGRVVWKSGMI